MEEPIGFSQVIVKKTMSPTVSHILFLAVLRANCVCMMAKFVVEHHCESKFPEWTNPTKGAGLHLDLVYKDLYPSLLSSPRAMVESRNVFPPYASAASWQCTRSELPRLARQIAENYRIEANKVFFRHCG